MFNIKNAVEKKVIGNKIRTFIEDLDTQSILEIGEIIGDTFKKILISESLMLTDMVKDNKEQLIKLAEDNSNLIISLNNSWDMWTEAKTNKKNQDNVKSIKSNINRSWNEFLERVDCINEDSNKAVANNKYIAKFNK